MSSTWTGSRPASASSCASVGVEAALQRVGVVLVGVGAAAAAVAAAAARTRRRGRRSGAAVRRRAAGVALRACSRWLLGAWRGCGLADVPGRGVTVCGGRPRCPSYGRRGCGPERSRTTRWRRQAASSRSGWSSRQWQPRVSSRRRAAATRTRATQQEVGGLPGLDAGLGGLAVLVEGVAASRCSRSSCAGGRRRGLSAERSTPAPSVMIRWIADAGLGGEQRGARAVAGRRDRLRARARGGRRRRGRPAMSAAMRSAKTRPSSRELEASRFAPCTPVQATSPQAYRPGTVVRPCRSVRTPPEA